MSNIIPFHAAPAAKVAGVRSAVFLAVRRLLGEPDAVIYAAKAAKQVRTGEASPALAVATAIMTARRYAQQGPA